MIRNEFVRVTLIRGFVLSLALTATGAGADDTKVPGYVQDAVASLARPAYDKARDADRKPADIIAFAGVKPGDKVLELIPMRNYYTRMLSKVVGPKGTVYAAMVPVNRPQQPGAAPTPNPINFSIELARAAEFRNIVPINAVSVAETGGVSAPEQVDVVWTTDNYHDFYNPMFGLKKGVATFNKSMFDALKPGGVYLVVDHAAAAGTGATQTDTLHRIDPEQVKKDAEAVGFVFDGESSVLANPTDDHSQPVFALRGKSDDFVLRFRKPKNAKSTRPTDSEMKAYFGNSMVLGSAEQRARTVFFLENHLVEDFGLSDVVYGVWWLDADGKMCFLHESSSNGTAAAATICSPNFFAASKGSKPGDVADVKLAGMNVLLMPGFVYPNVPMPGAPAAAAPPPLN